MNYRDYSMPNGAVMLKAIEDGADYHYINTTLRVISDDEAYLDMLDNVRVDAMNQGRSSGKSAEFVDQNQGSALVS